MAKALVHNKILKTAAREVLQRLGLRQQGRSRNWYDDRGWCVIRIWFDSSRWQRGSYLSVGVQWLWYPREFECMEFGGRENGFIEFESEDQFREAAMEFAQLAAKGVQEYRVQLATLAEAYDAHLFRYAEDPPGQGNWLHLNMGVLAALNGKVKEARSHLSNAFIPETEVEWQAERNRYIQALLDVLDDPKALRAWLEGKIAECRALLKLEALPGAVLPAD